MTTPTTTPTGLIKTIIWTQISEAIKKDFNIDLPLKTGPETTKVIEDITDMIKSAQEKP